MFISALDKKWANRIYVNKNFWWGNCPTGDPPMNILYILYFYIIGYINIIQKIRKIQSEW
jgi:hypothetical protein